MAALNLVQAFLTKAIVSNRLFDDVFERNQSIVPCFERLKIKILAILTAFKVIHVQDFENGQFDVDWKQSIEQKLASP